MKFLSAIVVATVVLGANSAALPEAEAQRNKLCAGSLGHPWVGQACYKKRDVPAEVKREAEADAQKNKLCGGTLGRPWVGQACYKRDAEPWAQNNKLCAGSLGHPWVGQACYKKRDVQAEVKREAEADAQKNKSCAGTLGHPWVGQACYKREAHCATIGMSCPMKREASPEAEPTSCAGVEGHSYVRDACLTAKRAAEAFAEAIATPNNGEMTRRDAEAEAACYFPGAPCDLAKREAYALAAAAADALPIADAEEFYADASLKLRSAFPDFEGEVRVIPEEAKRDANADWCAGGRACMKTKRAAEALAEALLEPSLMNKREAVPEAEAQCFAADGPCDIAKRSAHALFQSAFGVIEKL